MATRKTDPNHKAHFIYGVCATCSCGWSSATTYGKGAKHDAAAQWHWHRDQCDKAKAEAQ